MIGSADFFDACGGIGAPAASGLFCSWLSGFKSGVIGAFTLDQAETTSMALLNVFTRLHFFSLKNNVAFVHVFIACLNYSVQRCIRGIGQDQQIISDSNFDEIAAQKG